MGDFTYFIMLLVGIALVWQIIGWCKVRMELYIEAKVSGRVQEMRNNITTQLLTKIEANTQDFKNQRGEQKTAVLIDDIRTIFR